eukprot:3235212-Pleurochrysis_carterae.AAC.1
MLRLYNGDFGPALLPTRYRQGHVSLHVRTDDHSLLDSGSIALLQAFLFAFHCQLSTHNRVLLYTCLAGAREQVDTAVGVCGMK